MKNYNNPIYIATLKRYEDLKKEYVLARGMSDSQRMKEIEIKGKKTKTILLWMEKILVNKNESPEVVEDQTVHDALEIFG